VPRVVGVAVYCACKPTACGDFMSRVLAAAASDPDLCGVVMLSAPPYAFDDPASPDAGPRPYPELRYFTATDPAPYAMSNPPGASLPDQPGYWFITAQGLHCGIWFWEFPPPPGSVPIPALSSTAQTWRGAEALPSS